MQDKKEVIISIQNKCKVKNGFKPAKKVYNDILTYLKTKEKSITLYEKVEVSLLFCDDSFIKDLNFKYRNKNSPTDVLAFPQQKITKDYGNLILGDIVISLETAQKQAENLNHPLEKEVKILFIHGILHLLGYKDYEEEEKLKMFTVSDEICNNLNI